MSTNNSLINPAISGGILLNTAETNISVLLWHTLIRTVIHKDLLFAKGHKLWYSSAGGTSKNCKPSYWKKTVGNLKLKKGLLHITKSILWMSSILSQHVYSTGSLLQSANSSELWCIKQASVANIHFEVYQNVTLTIKTCSGSDKHSVAHCTLGEMTPKSRINASLRDALVTGSCVPECPPDQTQRLISLKTKDFHREKKNQISWFSSCRLKERTAWWDTTEDDVQTVLKSVYD